MDRTTPGNTHHIVAKYDEELRELSTLVLRMGGMAESQLASAIQAVVTRDGALADTVIAGDKRIDELEIEIDTVCTRLLALRQPMAVDLRAIIAAFKLGSDIERIGDYAKNLARRSKVLTEATPQSAVAGMPRMGALVQRMIKDVLDAYVERDLEKAIDVWRRDGEVDLLHNSLMREFLTYMMEDVRTITPCTQLLFMAKNIERIGDHATNMAENVHFLITGERLVEARPKTDDTAAAIAADAEMDRDAAP